jgi:hypothetical protein
MRDANENILKVLNTNVQESVDFLDKCVKQLSQDLIRPFSSCFSNINPETGDHELVWSNSMLLELDLVKQIVSLTTYRKTLTFGTRD